VGVSLPVCPAYIGRCTRGRTRWLRPGVWLWAAVCGPQQRGGPTPQHQSAC